MKMYTKKPHAYEVTDVSMGINHICAITSNGSLYTAGRGNEGQLGVEITESTENSIIEVCKETEAEPSAAGKFKETVNKYCFLHELHVFGKQDRAISSACGDGFTLVLNEFNKVYSFGDASDGCLGHPELQNSEENRYLHEPRLIQALFDKKIEVIAAASHNCACTTEEGDVYVWGFNYYDQLGIGIKEKDFHKPMKLEKLAEANVRDISCGYRHTACLVKPFK